MSEFGSGVVVPLMKFTRHLDDRHADMLRLAMRWAAMEPSERFALIESDAHEFQSIVAITEKMDVAEVVQMYGTMWANGASDHLIDLDLNKAPGPLKKLRKILLELRWQDGDRKFDENQWGEILALWKESAMDIDERLGVNSDWGDWA